ncbi:MAG: hypothetical protein Q4Q23_08100 [Methanobacteriaceae archaeon]|nr:hypothetical protein [Methanobacteriaceae archaeon]
MSKNRFSISVGDKTAQTIRKTSEDLEINISAFITMLVNNWEKEQRAMDMMNNMDKFKQIIEEATNGSKGNTEEN